MNTILDRLNPYAVGGQFASISRTAEQVRLVRKLARRLPEDVTAVGFYDRRGDFYTVWERADPSCYPNAGLADGHYLTDYIARTVDGGETTLASLYS